MSDVLQQVQIPVIGNTECKKKYRIVRPAMDLIELRLSDIYVICAGFAEGGKGACFGDSGSPLMLPIENNGKFAFYQIGITSSGLGCGRENTPAIFTKVQQEISWIQEKLLK